MKRFGWRSIAATSVLLTALAGAATRPQYGGTLHVAIREAPASLDPSDATEQESFARRNLLSLIFETLVMVDDRGAEHPGLAASWQAAPGSQRWQFRLREGVKFHDGSPLTAEVVASSLRTANPAWNVRGEGDTVIIERDAAAPDLPAELGLPRNSIVKRNGGKLSGTAAFHIEDWQPGKKLTLRAEENYWRGRPFVDAIEIEMGRNLHDQAIALELGKADVIEVAPEQAHRIALEGRRVVSSQPVELVALVFAREAQSPEEKRLRQALALSVDRGSMKSVILQGAGEPAASILPTWMSGYGFVFSSEPDLAQARQAHGEAGLAANWGVGYDSNDANARLLVERLSLNAHDAGLTLQPTSSANADVRLVRIPLASADGWIALTNAVNAAGIAMPKLGGHGIDDLYAAEHAILASERIVPLFHLPACVALSPAVQDWTSTADGRWNLADLWLRGEKP